MFKSNHQIYHPFRVNYQSNYSHFIIATYQLYCHCNHYCQICLNLSFQYYSLSYYVLSQNLFLSLISVCFSSCIISLLEIKSSLPIIRFPGYYLNLSVQILIKLLHFMLLQLSQLNHYQYLLQIFYYVGFQKASFLVNLC